MHAQVMNRLYRYYVITFSKLVSSWLWGLLWGLWRLCRWLECFHIMSWLVAVWLAYKEPFEERKLVAAWLAQKKAVGEQVLFAVWLAHEDPVEEPEPDIGWLVLFVHRSGVSCRFSLPVWRVLLMMRMQLWQCVLLADAYVACLMSLDLD